MTRGRRPSDSFPQLEFDRDVKTERDPPRPRRRTSTPANALETLPGFEAGRELGRREGVILACETFLAAWLSNPRNDVGVAHLQAQEMARRCGVKWSAPIKGRPAAATPRPAPPARR